ncbi:hypothetical protein I6F37_39625, partial [Bradyrhizobium sp. NBAIM08]|nr:hypothetical protein [Bradyrhizobium sp. NBAIM08]
YSTVTLGVPGTAMAGYPQLTEDERWALAFYLGGLRVDASDAARGAALWRSGKAAREVGTLHSVSTLSEGEVAAQHGADTAAAFAWLMQNPSATAAAKEAPIAYSRRLLAESMAAYRDGKRDEAQRLALTSYLEGFELAEASLDTIDRD